MPPCPLPFLALFLLALSLAGAAPRPLGDWRFQAGDELAWAEPGLDDGDWRRVTPPAIERLPWTCPRGWFRCRFPLDAGDREGDWGIWLGRIESADEVYLNGCQVGGTGVVADAFADAPRKLRLYRLPKELLRETNVLAARVQNSYPSGGLADVPELGAFPELLDRQRRLELRQTLLDAFLIGLMAALTLFWAVLHLHGLRRPDYRHVHRLALLLAAVFVFESPLVVGGGWLSPSLSRVYVALCLALPVPVLGLVAHVAESAWPGSWARWLRRGTLALAALYLAVGGLRTCATFHAVWIALLAATFALFVLAWRRGAAEGRGEFRMIGLGLAFLGAAALADFALGLVGSPWSHLPLHLCCASFAVAIMLGVGSRFARMQRTLHALSQRLLTSREDEAKRISGDLHDGLGQALASAKLTLQCLRQAPPTDPAELDAAFGALVAETSRSMDLLRRTVRNLRPASLTELGFAAALRELGEATAGVAFQFEIGDDARCAPALEDNLYRVAQEAVGNALRHARCKTVWIRFGRRDGRIRLEIDDDGEGFDRQATERSGKGLGLVAMRERLAAFGGTLTLRTEPGGGTTVTAEVPAP